MKTGFLKKLIVLDKVNSTSEEGEIQISGIRLTGLGMAAKFELSLDLKRTKLRDIQTFEEFKGEGNLVIFDLKAWGKIFQKITIQPEEVLDLKKVSKILLPRLKDFNWETVARYYDLGSTYSPEKAEQVFQLLLVLIDRIQRLSPAVYQGLMRLCSGTKDSWAHFLREGRKTGLKDFVPPEERNELLLDFQNSRGGKELGSREDYSYTWIKEDEVLKYYQDKGSISSEMEKFEEREEQKKMAQEVASAFNQSNFLLVEAGAGVGKSLAYLIPALLWAGENKEKCIVSTNTKNLQEQLFFKDLPLLEKALPFGFKVTMLKGKKNYLCLYRLFSLVNKAEYELPLEDQMSLANLIVWAEETESGDIAENSGFDLAKNGSLWNKVCCEGSFCLNQECPYYQRCFYFRTKKEATKSHLLVVNHSLLFSEVLAEGRTLTAENLILDEAHNLENVATQFLGKELSFWKIKEVLDRLYQKRLNTEWGALSEIKSRLQKSSLKKGEMVWLEEKSKNAIEKVKETYKTAEEFFRVIPYSLKEHFPNDGLKFRYKKEEKPASILKEEGEKLITCLKKLKDKLEVTVAGLEELRSSDLEGKWESIKALQSEKAELDTLIDSASVLFSAEDQEFVYWVEFSSQKEDVLSRFCMAPLEVGESLNQLLYDNLRTVILTSATLSVNGDFSYLKERLGLNLTEEERVKTLCLGSTFSFEKQARVLIPSFIPSPKENGYVKVARELIEDCGKNFRKNILALFTSYEMLTEIYSGLKPDFEAQGVSLLAQGKDGQVTNLFEKFKNEKGAILFGTSSFWEGVDAPGTALEILILVKLPFAVPTEPLASARMEKLEKEGKNPFLSYSLPEAVIKFKQGFGRLIRKKDDYGLVIILDSRVLTQRYGRTFLDSLPVRSKTVRNRKELLQEVSFWFEKENKLLQLKN